MKRTLTAAACLVLIAGSLFANEYQKAARLLPPESVRLLPSRFRDNFQRDSAWVMGLGADRLLHSFRTTAGVYSGNEGGYRTVDKLGGWESLDCELRGHTTGHILSALANMYASTGEECFKVKSDSLLNGLREVQAAYGNGYLSAFPEGLIDRNIRAEKVWAPWYTLHKIAAGLLDQYTLCGSLLALKEVTAMADWAYEKLKDIPEEARLKMLRNEFGGIGEAWWNLYAATGSERARFLAEFFYQKDTIDPLRAGNADFGTKHTNTFIPKVIAEARRYEITGDSLSRAAAEYFWGEMVSDHTFCTGSLSDREHFFPTSDFKKHISGYTGETCCTYNMLRLTEHIYEWDASPAAADYYERALLNHILGQQNPSDGMVSYFLPLAAGSHRVYSTRDESFWCCVGSGFESHAKYNRFIYAEQDGALAINLFIPSEVRWNGMKLRLTSNYPYGGHVRIEVVECDSPVKATLKVRQPSWAGKFSNPWKTCTRKWKKGSTVELDFNMRERREYCHGDSSVFCVMRGPVVLGKPLGTEGFRGSEPYSDPDAYNDYYKYDYNIPQSAKNAPCEDLKPLFDIHGERYKVYWDAAGEEGARIGAVEIPSLGTSYPRMADASTLYNKDKTKIDCWLHNPSSLEGRLQMYWDSHATEIFIAGEQLDHTGGEAAPVPTVRYPASRSTVCPYQRPDLKDVPIRQDGAGLWMKNKKTGSYEMVDHRSTGRAVESINLEILKIARDAAALYFKSGDETYARLAAKVFDTYMTGIYYRSDMPQDILHTHQQTLVGLTSFEVIHEDAVVPATECYDLLHAYLEKEYPDKLPVYEEAFRKWADIIIANGVPQNNWDLIQAQFILRIALVISPDSSFGDSRGREWYLNRIFNEDSIRQWSVGRLIDYGFDLESGLWKECPNYSTMVLEEFSSFVKLSREVLGIDLPALYPILEKAVKTVPQYTFPNGETAAWGDGYYQPLRRNYFLTLEDPLSRYVTPTFHSDEVSWFASRSGNDAESSLMMSVSGSNGNHMHAGGISLELYGKGYVLAPDAGRGAGYETLDHNEYYAQFPAHNTVCVDGASTYATMQSRHPYTLESFYPAEGAPFEGVSYGDFSFTEPETGALQRRQVIMTDGYYVDIFRSRKPLGGGFHDYFFHGLGQEFILDAEMKPTEELAFAGAHLYAYSYFWDKMEADGGKDVTGKFVMTMPDSTQRGLKMWMAGAPERRIYKAKAPAINSYTRTQMPYDIASSPCNVFVARQSGDAWNRPFVAVYEPFRDSEEEFIRSISWKDGVLTIERTDGKTDIIETRPDGTLTISSNGKTISNR